MENPTGMWSRLRQRLFVSTLKSTEPVIEISNPESPQEEEVVQGTDSLELSEQLKLIEITSRYLDEYFSSKLRNEHALTRGFALKSEMYVTRGEEMIHRVNMDVFYQDSTGERRYEYMVSLVRFDADEWHVFQVK